MTCVLVVILVFYLFFFFFFKQKTAYEMRISDWSSDVCSSDLLPQVGVTMRRLIPGVMAVFLLGAGIAAAQPAAETSQAWYDAIQQHIRQAIYYPLDPARRGQPLERGTVKLKIMVEIGRASCRDRVCQYV